MGRGLVFTSIILGLVFVSTVFAASWTGSGLDLNASSAKGISGILATINYSGSDLNAVCFNTTDTVSANCYETEIPSTFNVALTSSLTGISSDGNYTLYAFLKQDDGNYSASSSEQLLIDSTAPTYTVFPANSADYNYDDFVFDINFTDASSIVSSIKLDGATIVDGQSLSDLNSGAHTITIDANDALGNNAIGTITFNVDLNAPTTGSISTSYTSNYTNSTTPTFTLSASDALSGTSGGQMALSCTSSNFPSKWKVLTYATSYSDFNIVSSTYDCNSSDGNKVVFAKFRDKAGNWLSTAFQTGVHYEKTAPSNPTNLSVTAGNAKVTLSWTAAIADNLSGNKEYQVYLGNSSTNMQTADIVSISSTTKEITGLSNGVVYYFKVTTRDNAGNESGYSNEVSATPAATAASISVKKGTEEVSYAKNGDSLTIKCDFSSSASNSKITSKTINPSGSEQTIKEQSASTSTLSTTFTVTNASYTTIEFRCKADGASESAKQITIDNTAPTLAWVDTNNTFVNVRKIIFSASDNYSLKNVEIEMGGVKYPVTTKDNNNNFFIDFNTLTIESKEYTLKAIGYDSAGNSSEISRTVKVDNILTPRQMAEKLISEATSARTTANDFVTYFEEQALIFSEEMRTKKADADALLERAITEKESDTNKAMLDANNALILFLEFNNGSKNEIISSAQREYDLNSLKEILTGYGLSEERALEEITLLQTTGIERGIELVKIGDSNNYLVRIVITLNMDINGESIKIVEIIPKEIVDSARKIISSEEFKILKDDPIIEYTILRADGARKKIYYSVGEVTQEKAQEMMDNNVLSKYSTPPFIVKEEEKSEELLASKISEGNLLVLILGLIILIVLIAGAVYLVKSKGSGHGFGEKKSVIEKLTPEKQPEPKKWEANK